MFEIVWDWLNFGIRWLHIVTAIAWIGSSFYFIALDLGLKKRDHLPKGASGEAWQVHGGGFYHIQKYMVAPEKMPDQLTWFKWESYWTWISGFLMLCVLYYASSELFLIDRSVADLEPWQAISIGIGGIVLGWLVYDLLCKSPIGNHEYVLYGVLFVFVTAMGWAFTQVFSGRGAFIHTGAVIATMMTANVAHIIIPNQRKVVADLLAGKEPDPKLGKQAKQRSTHNNYLTLPVIFLMISNHYPLAFATQYNWLIIALVLVIGLLIRHFFNTHHADKGNPWWTWLGAALALAAIIYLSMAGPAIQPDDEAALQLTPAEQSMTTAAGFDAVRDIVESRCSMCHAAEPYWDGISVAPKNIILENDGQIARMGSEIYRFAAISSAMPPGNITDLEPAERRTLALWYENSQK